MHIIGDIDKQITDFYRPIILDGVKYGESQINVWVPSAGKTTIITDILSDKINGKYLVYYSCDQTENGTAKEIVNNIANNLGLLENNLSTPQLITYISNKFQQLIIKKNKPIVLIGIKFECLSDNEFSKLLDALAQIVVVNKRKIYSIVNCIDYPLIQKILSNKPSLYILANRVKFIPVISDKLLHDYIIQRTVDFDKKIPSEKTVEISRNTGGLLTLTKEAIRSYPNDGQIDVKFKSIWNQLPKLYQEYLKSKSYDSEIKKQLTSLGIINLTIFKQKEILVATNPQKFVEDALSDKDKKIFKLFISQKNKLVTKDQIAQAIWGDNYNEFYSDWTLDQIISRFRKRINTFGIDSQSLVTIKGRGYKWQF